MLISPKEDRRRFMLEAFDRGMCDGEYVFYTIEILPEGNVINPESIWASNDGRNEEAMQAFEAVFHVCTFHIRFQSIIQRLMTIMLEVAD